MRLVVDASVALKWLLDEPGTEAAVALRDEDLLAPEIMLVEAANGLWRHARLGQITVAQAFEAYDELTKAPVAVIPTARHTGTALRLATEMAHPVHDCIYLAAALHYGIDVVTADRRFVAAAGRSAFADRVRFLVS